MNSILHVNQFLLTDDEGQFNSISEIKIQGNTFNDEGSFGKLYECLSINGIRPNKALLIKILRNNGSGTDKKGYDTVIDLQQRMKTSFTKWAHLGYKSIIDIPAFRAFPQFSFEAVLNGSPVMGYAASNLQDLGFISFEKVCNGNDKDKYASLPMLIKFQFCFHLVRCFQLLSEINYVHADINPRNIFINLVSGELSLIDYDGGGLIDSTNDKTQVFGKLTDGEWLSPEIYEKIETNNSDVRPDEYSDRWSVSVAIHFLIFLNDPFFFVKEQSKRCKEAYLNNNKIYPINLDDENVSENALYFIDPNEYIIKNELPISIHNELIKTFEDGFFIPQKRTTYKQWIAVLCETQKPPEILFFQGDRTVLLANTFLTLSWQVNNAHAVFLSDGIGEVTDQNEIRIQQANSTTYYLKAIGHFRGIEKPCDIIVFPLPLIETLLIPAPDFNSRFTIKITISAPQIKHHIHFDANKLVSLCKPLIELSQNILSPKQRLYTHISSGILNVFNNIKKKHRETL